MRSFIWRKLFNPEPKLLAKDNYLNLGCGSNKISGYINADFFPPTTLRHRNLVKPDWALDFRYPLNCPDNIWDGVFSEHTLEHLYPDHAENLIREIYRTLKKEKIFRISVPDLGKYVAYYNNPDKDFFEEFKKQYNTGAEAIGNITQNYFHLSTWDAKLLFNVLKNVGFRNIEKKEFRTGGDPFLLIDQEHRAWESIYFEAQK